MNVCLYMHPHVLVKMPNRVAKPCGFVALALSCTVLYTRGGEIFCDLQVGPKQHGKNRKRESIVKSIA